MLRLVAMQLIGFLALVTAVDRHNVAREEDRPSAPKERRGPALTSRSGLGHSIRIIPAQRSSSDSGPSCPFTASGWPGPTFGRIKFLILRFARFLVSMDFDSVSLRRWDETGSRVPVPAIRMSCSSIVTNDSLRMLREASSNSAEESGPIARSSAGSGVPWPALNRTSPRAARG